MLDTLELLVAVIRAVIVTLLVGGGIIASLVYSMERPVRLSLIVGVCTLLIAGWQAYGVIHPSSDEAQWQEEQVPFRF